MNEHQGLKSQLEQKAIKAKNAEAENKMLVDRWMFQKMQDAERLNEVWTVWYIVVTIMCKHRIKRCH